MLTLYNREDCPFCWKIRIGFSFVGIFPKLINVPRGTQNKFVTKAHGPGTIPVLETDNIVLTQSTIILDYINDKYAKGNLLPGNTDDNARARSLCHYSDTIIGAALRNVIFQRRDAHKRDQDTELINQGLIAWQTCLSVLEDQIKGPYFMRDFSIVDCTLWPRMALAERYGENITRDYPKLYTYWQSAKSDPWFKL